MRKWRGFVAYRTRDRVMKSINYFKPNLDKFTIDEMQKQDQQHLGI